MEQLATSSTPTPSLLLVLLCAAIVVLVLLAIQLRSVLWISVPLYMSAVSNIRAIRNRTIHLTAYMAYSLTNIGVTNEYRSETIKLVLSHRYKGDMVEVLAQRLAVVKAETLKVSGLDSMYYHRVCDACNGLMMACGNHDQNLKYAVSRAKQAVESLDSLGRGTGDPLLHIARLIYTPYINQMRRIVRGEV